jgi:hypothetical protein
MPFLSSSSSLFCGRSSVLGQRLGTLAGVGRAETWDKRRLDRSGPGLRVPWLKPDKRPRRGGSGFD